MPDKEHSSSSHQSKKAMNNPLEFPSHPACEGDDILIPSAEAARMLLCRPQTLRARRLKGGKGCIPYIRLGESRKSRVAYRLSDLKAYLAARVYKNTAEESVKEAEARD